MKKKRSKIPSGKSRKMFSKTAKRVHRRNAPMKGMRGTIRA